MKKRQKTWKIGRCYEKEMTKIKKKLIMSESVGERCLDTMSSHCVACNTPSSPFSLPDNPVTRCDTTRHYNFRTLAQKAHGYLSSALPNGGQLKRLAQFSRFCNTTMKRCCCFFTIFLYCRPKEKYRKSFRTSPNLV